MADPHGGDEDGRVMEYAALIDEGGRKLPAVGGGTDPTAPDGRDLCGIRNTTTLANGVTATNRSGPLSHTEAGRVSNMVNLFDRNMAGQRTGDGGYLDAAETLDRMEAQSLQLEPSGMEIGTTLDDDIDMGEHTCSVELHGSSTKLKGTQVADTISIQLNPNTFIQIMQSLSHTKNQEDPSLPRQKAFATSFRKSHPTLPTSHIYRTSPYKTRSFPLSFQARRMNTREKPTPYPESSISSPLTVAFPSLIAQSSPIAQDTTMSESSTPIVTSTSPSRDPLEITHTHTLCVVCCVMVSKTRSFW